jgi:hypothetical protein
VILPSATESDRAYLLEWGEFLLNPRRVTMALSRAAYTPDRGPGHGNDWRKCSRPSAS